MSTTMIFNNNIKILRQRKNRTQDIVAGELNVSRSTVNSYENGSIKNPTLDALMMFSKYYKVIAVDTRGQGKSTTDSKIYTYDLFAEDMNLLLEYLHIDQVTVIGWSDGGNRKR